jgi:hypothetical protein
VHHEARQFVFELSQLWPCHFNGSRVLEVGSLNVNGTVRDFFKGCDYYGIDLGPGPCVDLVKHVVELPVGGPLFDVVISVEALEHDVMWVRSLPAMWALVKPCGLLIVTCAGLKRGQHGVHGASPWCSPYTLDHYQGLSDEDLRRALPIDWHTESNDLDTRAYAVKRQFCV